MTASIVPVAPPAAHATGTAPGTDSASGTGGAAQRGDVTGAGRRRATRFRRVLLGAIVLLGLLLRVWALDQSPPSLDPDEVSIGYNAWSLARTGRDEYGHTLPLTFRAFGEYKRPAYIYAAVPGLALLGPTPHAVRLPAAALRGPLRAPPLRRGRAPPALLAGRAVRRPAAGRLSLAPAVHPGRAGGQPAGAGDPAAGVRPAQGLARPPRGALPGRPWYVCAGLAFLLALYDYPGALVFAPLFVLVLARCLLGAPPAGPPPLARRRRCSWWAPGWCPWACSCWTGAPASASTRPPSSTSPPCAPSLASAWRATCGTAPPGLLNEPLALGLRGAVNAYLSHFDPTYLFTTGDQEWRHHSQRPRAAPAVGPAPALRRGGRAGAALAPPGDAGHRRLAPDRAGGGDLRRERPPRRAHHRHAPGLVPPRRRRVPAPVGLAPAGGATSGTGCSCSGSASASTSSRSSATTPWSTVAPGRAGPWKATGRRRRRWTRGATSGWSIPQEYSLSYVYALFATAYDPARYLAQGGSVADPTHLVLSPGRAPCASTPSRCGW